jgi:hypothetical protein
MTAIGYNETITDKLASTAMRLRTAQTVRCPSKTLEVPLTIADPQLAQAGYESGTNREQDDSQDLHCRDDPAALYPQTVTYQAIGVDHDSSTVREQAYSQDLPCRNDPAALCPQTVANQAIGENVAFRWTQSARAPATDIAGTSPGSRTSENAPCPS